MKKVPLVHQNHGLSPLQKSQFCLLFKSIFILSRKACFLTRTSPNTFCGFILHNTKGSKNFQFLTKTMDEPLWKNANFCGFWKPMFSLFRKACLLYKTSKIVFSPFIVDIYDMGTQGVTWGS